MPTSSPPPPARTPLLDAPEVRALAARLGESGPTGHAIEDAYPLSPFQEGMFYESLTGGTSDLYLVQQRIRIDGPLRVDAFREAWRHVFARQPALRTAFLSRRSGSPVQVVCRGLPFDVDFVDLTSTDRPKDAIEARAAQERRRGFELASPPLQRVVLFGLAPDTHEVLTSQPHLLLDGWSNRVVLQEVFAVYEALHADRAPELPEAPAPRAFIEWLESRDQGRAESFWRELFRGLAGPTRMTGAGDRDLARQPAQERARHETPRQDDALTRYVSCSHVLPAALGSEVGSLARAHRVTINTVLTGAMAVLLGRYNARHDVTFAFVATGRPPELPGVESMVGTLINALPLRVEVEEEKPLGDWLKALQRGQAALMEHEHTALSLVQAWSGLEPGVALTDTLFSYGNFASEVSSPSGVAYRPVGGFGRTGFPLSISVAALDPVRFEAHFAPRDLDEETARRLLEHLGRILTAMVADPDATVGTLEMLSPAEVEAHTVALHEPARAEVPEAPVHTLVEDQARRTPDAPAVRFEDRVLTYRELDEAANRLAHHLASIGTRPGATVAVCVERSLDFPVALLAVHKAGCAFVPLDPAFPPERLDRMVQDSGSGTLLTTAPILRTAFLEPPERVVCLDESRDDIGAHPGDSPEIVVGPEHRCHVYFTSGSTGRPKGAAVRHAALTNCLHSLARRPVVSSTDVLLSVTTPTFDPVLQEIFVPLMVGGTVAIASPDALSDPVRLAEALDRFGATMMFATPSRWQLLLSTGWKGKPDLVALYGGEAMPEELAERLLERTASLWNLYGTTETTLWSSVGEIRAGPDTRIIGEPLANTWFYVLDHELRPLPLDRTGRLFIGGRGLAEGYLGLPEQTSRSFVADPYAPGARIYDTGDLARRTSRGIELHGRADAQVKVRGHRIELGEIEAVLASHPGVEGAAARVVGVDERDQRLIAYYVSTSPDGVEVDSLREHVAGRLPAYMVPQGFEPIDAMPLTPSGKLDRKALPTPKGRPRIPPVGRTPETGAQRLVTDVCAELLGIQGVDLGATFFDLGGHSLLSLRLVTVLEERTGVRIDPRVLAVSSLEQVASRLSPTVPDRSTSRSATPAPARGAADEDAFYFAHDDGPLFGIHHPPAGGVARDRALLLCPPVGWEMTHTHLALKGLARRAAREGFHVLRFDYFGTGDSWGEGDEVSLERWVGDVDLAGAELRDRAGELPLAVVGLRMGATLAFLACRNGLEADPLVLWDPVVDGHRFLQTQRELHVRFDPDPEGELLGQPYPPALRDGVEALDLRRLGPSPVPAKTVVSAPERDFEEWADAALGTVSLEVVEDAGGWGERGVRNRLVLPSNIPSRILEILGSPS